MESIGYPVNSKEENQLNVAGLRSTQNGVAALRHTNS
jgi:hypothetical protein